MGFLRISHDYMYLKHYTRVSFYSILACQLIANSPIKYSYVNILLIKSNNFLSSLNPRNQIRKCKHLVLNHALVQYSHCGYIVSEVVLLEFVCNAIIFTRRFSNTY